MSGSNQLSVHAHERCKSKGEVPCSCNVLADVRQTINNIPRVFLDSAAMNHLANNQQDVQNEVVRKCSVSILIGNIRLENALEYNFIFLLFPTFNNYIVQINIWKCTKEHFYSERKLWQIWEFEFLTELIVIVNRVPNNGQIDQRPHFYESRCLIDELTAENLELKNINSTLEQHIKEKDNLLKELYIRSYQEKIELLEQNMTFENKLMEVGNAYEKLKVEHNDTLFDLGKLSVETAANVGEKENANVFENLFRSKDSTVSVMLNDQSVNSYSSTTSTNTSYQVNLCSCDQNHSCKSGSNGNFQTSYSPSPPKSATVFTETRDSHVVEHLPNAGQEEEPREMEPMSLISVPNSPTTALMLNAYKLLLVTISHRLLLSDIEKLKIWANEQFSVETNLSAVEIVFQLDRNGAISATDLSPLSAFLESILRYDLLHLIESYCSGDYVSLKRMISMASSRNRSRTRTRVTNVDPEVHLSRVFATNGNVDSNVSNTQVLERTSTPNDDNVTFNIINEHAEDNLSRGSKIPDARGNRMTARGNYEVECDGPVMHSRIGKDSSNKTASCESSTTAAESNRVGMSRTTRSSMNRNIRNYDRQCDVSSHTQSSNHFHVSKSDNNEEEEWLCNHYKRRCFVKFDCCNTFWPCHRCHNSESTCGGKKLKSRDTKMVKCVECGKEQQFGENGQFCVQCDTKFADFYCGQCKHLTGMDDYPYHCDKCGICRIHGDRSFHCDVCGVCLDVQLRGSHKCRPDSAHDECGICLEDAFTGCQILPCSHKVHKNCATRMIQSGM